jgi:hypothetical protein
MNRRALYAPEALDEKSYRADAFTPVSNAALTSGSSQPHASGRLTTLT